MKSGVYVDNLTEEYVCTMKDVTHLLLKVSIVVLLDFIMELLSWGECT